MPKDLSQKILEKIKKGEIQKKSPFYFMVKNYFFWTFGLLSLLVGAAVFSSFLVKLFWSYGPWYKLSPKKEVLSYFMQGLSLFWVFLFAIFCLSAWFNYKHTEKAYKKNNFWIVLMIFLSSLVLGVIFFISGMGELVDEQMKKTIHFYERSSNREMMAKRHFLENLGIDTDEFFQKRNVKRRMLEKPKGRIEMF